MPAGVEVKYALDLGEASSELLDWAKENLGEDPDTKCELVSAFRDMIYSRGECTPVRTDDAFLLRFLRSRKFKLEASHRLMVNYCDFREDMVDGVGLDILEKVGRGDVIRVPPYRDQLGRRLLLYRFGNWDPETVTIDEIVKASLLILELAIMEPHFQIYGGVCIIDCQNLSVQNALHLTPGVVQHIFQLAVTSVPMRLEGMHVINHPWALETFFGFIRPLLDAKMKERLFFHGCNLESLHKHVYPERLPKIFGGKHVDYDYKKWLSYFRKTDDIMNELKTLGYETEEDKDINEL